MIFASLDSASRSLERARGMVSSVIRGAAAESLVGRVASESAARNTSRRVPEEARERVSRVR